MKDCLWHLCCGCCAVTQEYMEVICRNGVGWEVNICAAADELKLANYRVELFRLVATTL